MHLKQKIENIYVALCHARGIIQDASLESIICHDYLNDDPYGIWGDDVSMKVFEEIMEEIKDLEDSCPYWEGYYGSGQVSKL